MLLLGAGKGIVKTVKAVKNAPIPKLTKIDVDPNATKPGSAYGDAQKVVNQDGNPPAGQQGNNPNVDPNNIQANNNGNAGFNNPNLNQKPADPKFVPLGGKKKSNNIAEDIASEAAQGFKNLECVPCRNKIELALKRLSIKFEIVEIKAKGGPYNIYSDKYSGNISTNGYHTGVKIGDIVFDNHNPNGIDINAWKSDLFAPYGIDTNITIPN